MDKVPNVAHNDAEEAEVCKFDPQCTMISNTQPSSKTPKS